MPTAGPPDGFAEFVASATDGTAGKERVRRHRRRMAVVASAALVGLVVGLPMLAAKRDSQRTDTPVAKADGVLRTAGCGVVSYPPGPSVNGEAAGNKQEIDALVARIEPYVVAHFRDIYTGLELDNDHDLVRVYRLPSAEFDNWIRAEFADACVEVATARHSLDGTAELSQRIDDDSRYWSDRGIEIYLTHVALDGTVVVGVRAGDVRKAQRELPARYGNAIPIAVEVGDQPVALETCTPVDQSTRCMP